MSHERYKLLCHTVACACCTLMPAATEQSMYVGCTSGLTVVSHCIQQGSFALFLPQPLKYPESASGWIIWLDYYSFKLIARREWCAGQARLTLTRERVAHCTVNLSFSQQQRFVLIGTKVRQESFSVLYSLV